MTIFNKHTQHFQNTRASVAFCCLFPHIVYLQTGYYCCPKGSSYAAEELEFSYSSSEQKSWYKNFPQCGGRKQSPVEIKLSQVNISNLPAVELIGYSKVLPGPIVVENNGHTVRFNLPQSGAVPFITGNLLSDEKYELQSFHFHWGKVKSRGSEHVIDGKRYPVEMHLVHVNSKYRRSTENAIGKKDGIVVLAVLYEFTILKATALNPVVEQLNNVIEAGQSITLAAPSFSMRSLFPTLDLTTFYKYKGSLTTPPCSEPITWIIFPYPLPKISNSQLKSFRKLRTEAGTPLYDNFRHLQPLNGRQILFRGGKHRLLPNLIKQNIF